MTVGTRVLRSQQTKGTPTKPTKGSSLEESVVKASPIRPRPFVRTCSSPAHSTCSSTSSSNAHARTRSFRSRLSFSTPSFSSPMSVSRSSLGHDESDESEDEQSSVRLGGCQRRGASTILVSDDSNKENVAPLRRLTQAALLQEELAQQEENVALRTRARAAAPMSDRSSSFAGSTCSTVASIKNRSFRRTVSSPIAATRKRLRGAIDTQELEAMAAAGDADVRTPTTPLSRMRYDLSKTSLNNATSSSSTSSRHDDAESYFSSQATSIFDNASILESQASLSRCTSPDLEDTDTMAVEEKAEATEVQPRFAHIYAHAKALLRYGSGTDSQIVGRDRERSSLQRFLHKRFNLFAHLEHSASPQGESIELDGAVESGSLYVCGLPGTGKTALVKSILSQLPKDDSRTPRIAFVDCMTVQHPREVFVKVLQALNEPSQLPSGEAGDLEAEKRLAVLVKNPHQRILIVLDEIDHLMRNRAHQNILYRVFSWGSMSTPAKDVTSGSCALIGIANSLDLTERFVPLLASKGAAPAVLNFRPFEAAEMMTVLKARLSQLYTRYDTQSEMEESTEQESTLPLLEPVALELAAKKIAAATGDLRKALDACRLAIDAVEIEVTKKNTTEDVCKLTMMTAPKVKASHILKVLSTVLGSPQLTKVRGLGLQSKLILLALLIAQKRQATKLDVLGASSNGAPAMSGAGDMQIRTIESTYIAMLKNDEAGAFSTVESSELIDVVEGLEVEGVLRIISDASSSTNGKLSSSSNKIASSGVSPSGKRAAKKQLLAANRGVSLLLSTEDVLKGVCTVSPSAAVDTSKVVIEAMNRIWNRESDRVERCKSWQAMEAESRAVKENELGGGRGAIGI